MADGDAGTSTTTNRRSWVLPFVMVLCTVTFIVATYYVLYLTRQRTYFAERSVRLLGVVAQGLERSLKTKVGSLAFKKEASVGNAESTISSWGGCETRPRGNPEDQSSPPITMTISSGAKRGFLKIAKSSESSQIKSDSRAISENVDLRAFVDWTLLDERFDDVWLVDSQNQVLAQINAEARPAPEKPKIENAADAANAKGLGSRVGDFALPADALHVDVWGARHLAFAYPIDLPSSFERGGLQVAVKTDLHGLQLYGVIRESRFTGDAVALSYLALMILSAIVLLGFLALPYLKVRFMARRERLRAIDIWLLGASGIAAAQLATLAIIITGWQALITTHMDRALENFAREIDAHASSELAAAGKQLEADALELMRGPSGMRGNALSEAHAPRDYPYFEATFYTDRSGWQVAKRNPWFTPTACVSIGDQSYFGTALQRRDDAGAVLESIDAPNSGKQLAVLARPVAFAERPAVGSQIPKSARYDGVAVLATELQSLINAVTPFPLEYVVLDGKGNVLFRSREGKNARENFLAEVDWSSHLHAQVTAGARSWLNARYLGRPHRMYLAPLKAYAGTPMLLATYYDRTVIDTLMYEATTASLVWIFAEWLLVTFAVAASRVVLGPRFGDWMWPTERRSTSYALASLACLALSAALLLAVRYSAGSAGGWLVILVPPFVLFAMSWPGVATVSARVADECDARVGLHASRAGYPYSYLVFGIMLLVLTGVIPAAVVADDAFSSYVGAFRRLTEREMATELQHRQEHIGALYVSATPEPGNDTIGLSSDDERGFECCRLSRSWDVYSPLFVSSSVGADSERAPESEASQPEDPTCADWTKHECVYLERQRRARDSDSVVPRCGLGLGNRPVWSRHNALTRVAVACLPVTGSFGLDLRAQIFESDADASESRTPGTNGPRWVTTRDGSWQWSLPPAAHWRIAELPWPQIVIFLMIPAGFVIVVAWLVVRSVATDILGLELEGDGVLDQTAPVSRYLDDQRAHLRRLAAGVPSNPPVPQRWLVLRPPQSVMKDLPDDFTIADLSEAGFKDPASGGALVDEACVIRAVESRLESTDWRADLVRRLNSARDKPLVLVSEIDPMHWLVGRFHETKNGADEIARWASALAAFRKARFKIPQELEGDLRAVLGPGATRAARRAIEVIVDECRWSDELADIGKRLDVEALAPLHRPQIVELIEDQAEPYYRKIWSLCSVEEKLVLIQLAEEGMVNPRHFDVLRRLRRRRLVRTHAQIHLMNESFERFVRGAESPSQIAEWESLEGVAGSARIRLPILTMATVATGLLLFTQQQLFDSLMGVMTAAVAAVTAMSGIVTSLRGQLASRSAK